MGLRFNKSFKVAPRVRLRVGSKSSSISVDGKGGRVTLNSKGHRATRARHLLHNLYEWYHQEAARTSKCRPRSATSGTERTTRPRDRSAAQHRRRMGCRRSTRRRSPPSERG
ncbi:DUF4236 domain-containing protein [Streptomyces mirabilis]|uniref:DUF4236 domain-containing protein n=1 Tax=Streptomyces mirabilis TaxID=68239 RepID=UPI003320D434